MQNANSRADETPLCVDLDGTFLRTDTLYENFWRLITKRPSQIYRLPFWLSRGIPNLKFRLYKSCPLDISNLPVNSAVSERISLEKSRGRKIVLVTAACEPIAKAIQQQHS